MTNKKTTAVVALAFPSMNPVPSRRRLESKNRANRFGEVRNLGESQLVSKDTFGYVVDASSPVPFMSDARQSGARVIPFTEANVTPQGPSHSYSSGGPTGKAGGYPGQPTPQGPSHSYPNSGPVGKSGGYRTDGMNSHGKTDPQGIEQATVASKSSDDGHSFSSTSSSKVKANSYGKSNSQTQARGLREGEWISLGSSMEATQIEMSGTQPIGNPVRGTIHPQDYYVLGVEEAVDGTVVTLGKTDQLAHIGTKEEGRHVYNVDGEQLAEILGGVNEDRSKAKGGGGGILSKKALNVRSKGRKAESGSGIIGAMAGAAQTPQRESQVTAESVHGHGLRVLRHLGVLTEQGGQVAPKSAAGKALLAENSGNASHTPSRAVPVNEARAMGADQATLLEEQNKQSFGGSLSGGPFDQPLEPGLENKLAMFRQGMQSGAHMASNQGITEGVVSESQVRDAMGQASVDPVEFALRAQLEQALAEDGVDINELSEEEVAELMSELRAANEEEHVEEGEDEPHGELFEDVLPGDVAKAGGIAALLSSRGYPNAKQIAAHIEAGDPANEWFGLTNGSLQDAKRLQWLHVQSGQKGHF